MISSARCAWCSRCRNARCGNAATPATRTHRPFLTVREALEFATIEGARANGLDRKIGTFTPGKEADIILLRTDRLNVMPINNAVGAVVTNMGPQNVDTVLIAGKVVKRDGQMLGLDFARLQRLGDEAPRDRVYAAAKVRNSRI